MGSATPGHSPAFRGRISRICLHLKEASSTIDAARAAVHSTQTHEDRLVSHVLSVEFQQVIEILGASQGNRVPELSALTYMPRTSVGR